MDVDVEPLDMGEHVDDRERSVVFREFDPDDCEPETSVVEAVADLEDVSPAELSALYTTIDDVIRKIFDEPPAPGAQVEVTFTYEGYRITVHQDGTAEFVKVA